MTTAIDTVRSFYENLAKGDVPSVMSLLHSDLRWTEAEGSHYFAGTWRHPEEVLEQLFKPLGRDWEHFSVVAADFLAERDRVVCLGNYSSTCKATNKKMQPRFAQVWRVADGKIVSFEQFTDTLLMRRAMEP